MVVVLVLAALTTEGKPANEEVRDGPSAPLTADEITLLQLAGRPSAMLNRKDVRRPTDLPGGTTAFLVSRFTGRSKGVAVGVAAREALVKLYAGQTKQFTDDVARFPAQMRRLAWTAAGLAIRGKDVPPPFTDEFNALTAPATKWMDDLRRSATRLKLMEAKVETAVLFAVNAVEADFSPAFGTDSLPAERFHLRPGPFCQSLTIKHVGAESLTNVLLIGRVTADKVVTELEGGQLLADLFNRSLSTERQADDARQYLIAENHYGSIPKGSVLYLPRLAAGDEVYLDLGYMTRGEDREGKNTATLSVYADQGRLVATDSRQFTQLPEPKRTAAPKPGELTSDPPPAGATDNLYPGSIWHGTVTVLTRTRQTKRFRVELIVKERSDTGFRGDVRYIGRSGPRTPFMGGIKDGEVRLLSTGGVLPPLPPGRLGRERLVFSLPASRGRTPRTPVGVMSSAVFTYVPPGP